MGFVWALPLVPWLLQLRGAPARPPLVAVAVAGLACAIPQPVAGWAAVAGTALVASVALFAVAGGVVEKA
jgi:hypothetical protein